MHSYSRAKGHSITDGHVYRGQAIPGLCGSSVYGDFVALAICGLR